MIAYIVRRLLYAVPILLGVNLVTFGLFFFINTPDDMARAHLGQKRVTLDQIEQWKRERNYHLPYFYNTGWVQEGAKETAAVGWIDLPPLARGPAVLLVQSKAAATFTLASGTGESVTAGASWRKPEEIKPPDGFEIRGSIDLNPGEQRAEFLVDHPKGAALKLHVGTKEPVVVRIRRYQDLSFGESFTQTIFWQKSIKYFWFDFGIADDGRKIGEEIRKRIPPSLAVTLPVFLVAVLVEITFAMILAFFRGTYLDFWGVILCVALMSVSIMFYVIGGQWILGQALRLVPVSGFDVGRDGFKFLILPVVIGVMAAVGEGSRWYRTIFLEEINKDYVRTARMKGIPESVVLFKHALKNAMIPILTGIVVSIPFLFIGSLILESFFSIPGMGGFTLEAINRQDFSIVQAMTFLSSVLYVVGLILTDISYTLVDPRVRLQ
jgi:peptide/nickel transport system permease protein